MMFRPPFRLTRPAALCALAALLLLTAPPAADAKKATAEPLPEKHMAAFKEHAEPLVAQLDSLGQVQVADNRDGD